MKNYNNWLNAFMESWKNLEGEKTCNLFSSKIEYYENPIDPPCTTLEDIKKLWKVVPKNQKDIQYTGEILLQNDEQCIYHFKMKRTLVETNRKQNIDGIFEIKLNNNNLLIYFKQWRYIKES